MIFVTKEGKMKLLLLLFNLLPMVAHADPCLNQQGKFNFLIERSIDPVFYVIKTDVNDPKLVEDYIARGAVALTGGLIASLDAVFSAPLPEAQDNEYTKEGILQSYLHLQSVPERLRRIGRAVLDGKTFDLWGVCK